MVAARLDIPSRMNPRLRSAIPRRPSRRPERLYRTLRELSWEGIGADVYLAFIGSGRLQLSGFLVTAKSNMNDIIAHCPVDTSPKHPKASYGHIHQQLELARRIAQNPRLADEEDEAISLGRLIRSGRPVPRWVYALACIPLSYENDGQFMYATPYCARLMGALKGSN
jgi:hypothetical protein